MRRALERGTGGGAPLRGAEVIEANCRRLSLRTAPHGRLLCISWGGAAELAADLRPAPAPACLPRLQFRLDDAPALEPEQRDEAVSRLRVCDFASLARLLEAAGADFGWAEAGGEEGPAGVKRVRQH